MTWIKTFISVNFGVFLVYDTRRYSWEILDNTANGTTLVCYNCYALSTLVSSHETLQGHRHL
jgi:hypothetical protein